MPPLGLIGFVVRSWWVETIDQGVQILKAKYLIQHLVRFEYRLITVNGLVYRVVYHFENGWRGQQNLYLAAFLECLLDVSAPRG
jgi:hypothetical protein